MINRFGMYTKFEQLATLISQRELEETSCKLQHFDTNTNETFG